MKNYVAYYRTSTNRQNLGIGAQKTMVNNYLNNVEGNLVAEFEEKESGKNDSRLGLEKAIQACEEYGATLTIAKLDRLSRSVSFLFQLRDRVMKNNIEIKALDLPSFNTMSLGIWATMAQVERENIANRTKLALSELKKSGVKLGKPENFKYEHRLKGAEAMKRKALESKANQQATALIIEYKENGWGYERIAKRLTELDFKTVRGKQFTSTGVMRLYKRFKNESNESKVVT